jgi:hypothetical protein
VKFQYIIKVNGLVMCSAPTKQCALAKVTSLYHDVKNVVISLGDVVIWKGN